MTKEELMSYIEFKDNVEQEDAEFYISVKGVDLHYKLLEFLGCKFSLNSKIKWSEISRLLRQDKRARDIIYIYIATLEEYIRAFISNKYSNQLRQNFWINGRGERNKIKNNLEHGQSLFEVLQNTDFGCLIQQVEKLPLEDKNQLFWDFYSKKNLAAVNELRNAVCHHIFLAEHQYKPCVVKGVENCSLINNIKNLRQLLPERYRYGKNGQGGITAEFMKCGINLDSDF